MINKIKILGIIISLLSIFQSCATYHAQYKKPFIVFSTQHKALPEESHVFYLVGDAGNTMPGESLPTLNQLKKHIDKANKNTTLIFLGDNIYEHGMPKKNSPKRKRAEYRLDAQININKDFKGNILFIPGNHDWYNDGLKGLKRQEEYVTKRLGKKAFLPSNGCPLKKIKINDDLVMLIIDSEWYLTDWDKHPTINNRCPVIKTREKFFEEVEGLIKKNAQKTMLILVHHPLESNGPHGGEFSLKQQIFPFDNSLPMPIIGSFINLIRKTSGISPEDLQNKRYNEFRQRIQTLAQYSSRVIFASGHEHNLQYLVKNNIPQIISGSGSKISPTRLNGPGQFSYGGLGYAKLIVYKDGSSRVEYYATKKNKEKLIFATQVLEVPKKYVQKSFVYFPAQIKSSIYTTKETQKGKLYTTLFGKHYRKIFSTKFTVPTVDLDTLYGGLTPIRRGGGHQSRSLRLIDRNGREYVMRALRKSATQYLQTAVFKRDYLKKDLENTTLSNTLQDAFTAAYPYASFVIPTLSKAVGLYYTDPKLYYIPKQKALKEYNGDYGDELYMIEDRPVSGRGEVASFGYAKKIISTDDLFKKLRADKNNTVNQKIYLRARLFDMLIGDWDRHEDQWRWAEREIDTKHRLYEPIPRDRDQAFSKYDGALLAIVRKVSPPTGVLQVYDGKLKNIKWMNVEPYPMDVALLDKMTLKYWLEEASYLQNHLNKEIFQTAFQKVPKEVDRQTISIIEQKFLERKAHLKEIAEQYYNQISKYAIVKGTRKTDLFEIVRKPNGKTSVKVYQLKKGNKKTWLNEYVYDKKYTKEIWLYGLDGADKFEVKGKGDDLIKLRLIGGENHDNYIINNRKQTKIYDFKSKKNTIKGAVTKRLQDNYKDNLYNFKKLKYNNNLFIPTLGANPDEGFTVKFKDIYTINRFERNPFSQRHIFSAQYFSSTQGFDLGYTFEKAYLFDNWNFVLDIRYTSPNYSTNYFGWGNETKYDKNEVKKNYNRVRIAEFHTKPGVKWAGTGGSSIKVTLGYETFKAEDTKDRFISQLSKDIFKRKHFAGIEGQYLFKNQDRAILPTLGMKFQLDAAWKKNLKNSHNFGTIHSQLSFDHKLSAEGDLILATELNGKIVLGKGYEFYQASTIGADEGLRGFRRQRFTGKQSFTQHSDLRWTLGKMNISLTPIRWGILGGFDYGRVWATSVENSNKWHYAYGAGLYLIAVESLTGKITYFHSVEGGRIAFGLGWNF